MAFDAQGTNSLSFHRWEDQVIAFEKSAEAIWSEYGDSVKELAPLLKALPEWADDSLFIEHLLVQMEVSVCDEASVTALLKEWSA